MILAADCFYTGKALSWGIRIPRHHTSAVSSTASPGREVKGLTVSLGRAVGEPVPEVGDGERITLVPEALSLLFLRRKTHSGQEGASL